MMDNLSSCGLRWLKREQECRAQPSKSSNQCKQSTTNKVNGVVLRSSILNSFYSSEGGESSDVKKSQDPHHIYRIVSNEDNNWWDGFLTVG